MKSPISRAVGPFTLLLLLTGCDRDGPRTISETRIASRPSRPVKLDATSAERFDMGRHMAGLGPAQPQQPQAAPHGGAKLLAWEVPAGWTEKPADQMRLGSFSVGGNADVDCSIVLLPGEAGGLDANVNRWLAQIGNPPLAHDQIEKLPARALLGAKGYVIEATGTFAGMGGQEKKAGYKLLGVIAQCAIAGKPATCFVKLTGPAAVVDAERAHLEALCDSIRATIDSSDLPPQPEPPTDRPALEWTAPSEWRRLGEAPMRLVTFGTGTQTECYVSVLPGAAGGLAPNLNRWRGQLGMAPLDDAGIAALPKVKLLGKDVALVEATGNYTDMQGQAHASYAMLGAIGQKGDSSVFVRMIGPEAEIKAERERFVAFAGSLR